MIGLNFIQGESNTGEKGNSFSHWEAWASDAPLSPILHVSVGNTPLEAVMNLAQNILQNIDS